MMAASLMTLVAGQGIAEPVTGAPAGQPRLLFEGKTNKSSKVYYVQCGRLHLPLWVFAFKKG
jgi:hypothetical protein